MRINSKDEPQRPIERLAIFIEERGESYRKFERSIGLANGYISKQMARKGAIGSNILERIGREYPELNIMWLITGKQQMIVECNLPDMQLVHLS